MKSVIITGGGGGIGRACAKVFSKNGYCCAVVDCISENARATVEEINRRSKHIFIEADVSNSRDIDFLVSKVMNRYNGIDALINCAAVNRRILDKSESVEERWIKSIDNDLKSVYLMSERVAVEFAKRGGGLIVNIGSIVGVIMGSPSVPYAAAKAGIVGITKSHARIYGAHNIRVNCILPGIVETSMVTEAKPEAKNLFLKIREQTPLKRWAKPSEIAELIYFVASDKCEFLTGATIVVDGGATLTLGCRLDETLPFKWEKYPPKK